VFYRRRVLLLTER
jgi:hypothetical protein